MPAPASSPVDSEPQILETLCVPERLPAWRELKLTRYILRHRPTDLDLALHHTRLCVEWYRHDGDPRPLSYAEAVLHPWWDAAQPPMEVRLWRAILKQSRHDFVGALSDLDAVVAERPDWPQAWLTRSTVLTVMGDLRRARESVQPLRGLTSDFVFTVADASLASLTGEAEASQRRLESLIDGSSGPTPSLRAWACQVLADIRDRLDDGPGAEQAFRLALAATPHDPSLVVAWCDWLLAQRRFREVLTWTAVKRHDHDGLHLRWLLAKAYLEEWDPFFVDGIAKYRSEELASHARHEIGHRRNEARAHLELFDDPPTALRLARENWEWQRETGDARVLAACARAANDLAAADLVRDWQARYGLEDRVLDRLLAPQDNP